MELKLGGPRPTGSSVTVTLDEQTVSVEIQQCGGNLSSIQAEQTFIIK